MRKNLNRVRWGAVLLALPAALVIAHPAMAADPPEAGIDFAGTGGCSGTAVSKGADAEILGVINNDLAASQDAPLMVARGGTVEYLGRSQELMTDNEWSVAIGGVPVSSGTGQNDEKKRQTADTAVVDDYLPVSLTGTMKVDVAINAGDGTDCTVVTWIKVDGNGFTSFNGLVGIGLLTLGLIGAALSLPMTGAGGVTKTHGLRGTLFGLSAGLGLAMLLVSTSVIALGSPWLVLGVTVGLGVIGGLAGKFLPARGGGVVAA